MKAPRSHRGRIVTGGRVSDLRIEELEARCLLATFTWTGQANTFAWTDPRNWQQLAAPSPGDDLVFPADTIDQNGQTITLNDQRSVNDFPALTSFHSITFGLGDPSYQISGNAIVLTGGIFDEQTFPPFEVSNLIGLDRIVLTNSQTFSGNENGQITFLSPIDLQNNNLTLDGQTHMVFLAPISGSGSVTKNGAGVLSVHAENSYTGVTTINGGEVNGQGTIAGTVILNQGTLSPGITDPGQLTTGNASFNGGAFVVNLFGVTPGDGYDQLNVVGSLNLAGSALNLSLAFTPSVGDSFVIINSSEILSGNFAGLADGATLTVNDQQFRIHYVTTNGHNGPALLAASQVVLTALGPVKPPPATPVIPLTANEKIFVTGADAGGGPNVLVFDAQTRQVKLNFFAYDAAFVGGVRTTVGDINGDRIPDIICGAGPGGGSDVRIFNGATGQMIREFSPYNPLFAGGQYLAAADVNGDGYDDILVGADAGGGPNVIVFSGSDLTMLFNFFAYDPAFIGGVRVAAGDVNGDGKADIVCGSGPGGGPNITVFSGSDGTRIRNFFAYDSRFILGLYVAAGDVNADGKYDIVAGAGAGGGPNVAVFSGADSSLLSTFFPYDPAFVGGVRVGAVKLSSGASAVLSVAGPGGGADVRFFDGVNSRQIDAFFAYDPRFAGGLYVSGN